MNYVDKDDPVQVDNLINFIAAGTFAGVDCEVCRWPMLQNGVLFDDAIRVNAPPAEPTWAHKSCYRRNN